jgi:hypothetical protein
MAISTRPILAENVLPFPDHRERRARRQTGRPTARRDETTAIEPWNQVFRPQRPEDFDLAIILTWQMHVHRLLSFDEAGARHHALVEQRDGRPVR